MTMLIPVEELIDGVVRTLGDAVLPDVGTGAARAQLYAAIDVLQNLRDRVEEKTELLVAEADSARAALADAVAALRAAGAEAAAARIGDALAATAAHPPAAAAAGLRAAVGAALEVLDSLPAEIAGAARQAIAAHLVTQAFRDVAVTKPSLLGEISKG
jgi:hypothetical protein